MTPMNHVYQRFQKSQQYPRFLSFRFRLLHLNFLMFLLNPNFHFLQLRPNFLMFLLNRRFPLHLYQNYRYYQKGRGGP